LALSVAALAIVSVIPILYFIPMTVDAEFLIRCLSVIIVPIIMAALVVKLIIIFKILKEN